MTTGKHSDSCTWWAQGVPSGCICGAATDGEVMAEGLAAAAERAAAQVGGDPDHFRRQLEAILRTPVGERLSHQVKGGPLAGMILVSNPDVPAGHAWAVSSGSERFLHNDGRRWRPLP